MVHCFLKKSGSIKERTQTSAEMGRSRHVVIHGVIHDVERNGHNGWQRPISYQDVALCLCPDVRAYIIIN